MTEKIKYYLGISLVLLTLTASYGIWSYVDTFANSVEPSSFRSFSVAGEGKIVTIPDIAAFTFSVITSGGKDIAALQKDNTAKMDKAIEFVKSAGVGKKDIKTENYNLSPRYQYYDCNSRVISSDGSVKPCPPAEIVGYEINQTVSVKIRDFEKIGEILSGVVKNGANDVSQLSFTIDDRTSVEKEARALAIRNAKTKAKEIASAGGFGIGRLIAIDEGGYASVARYYGVGGGLEKTMSSADAAPTIEAGSQEVQVNITLKYEIK